MHPAAFDYLAPETVEAAVEALAAEPTSRVLAGGHSLLPLMKLRFLAPSLLVDIGRIPGLGEIAQDGSEIVIGTRTTHAAAAGSPLLRQRATALAEAAATVGDPQVRNRGTLGGSAAHADPVADEPGALLALGAVLVAMGPDGSRRIDAVDFFVDALTTSLRTGEVLVELRLPAPGPGTGSAYEKLGRRGPGSDYPIAGAAAMLQFDEGTVTEARIAATGAAVTPSLLPDVASRMLGTDGSDAAIEAATRDAAAGLSVVRDLYGDEEYKRHLVGVFAARSLKSASERAKTLQN